MPSDARRNARLNCPGTAAVAVRRQPVPGATTGIAVTARGTGGRVSGPATGGSAGRPPGSFRLDRVTWPGETRYNQVERNFDVSRMENRLAADQRPRVLVTGGGRVFWRGGAPGAPRARGAAP